MKTRDMALCALFAALLAVCAWLVIPAGDVPFTLQTFGVFAALGLLGGKRGTIAIAVYLLLGAVGAPVFAGFKGGVSALLGPTGGYLIGYLPYAALAGLGAKKDGFWHRCLYLLLGTAICYTLGTAWFVHQTGRALPESLGLCVLPFLPGDAAKIFLSAALTPRLQKAIK